MDKKIKDIVDGLNKNISDRCRMIAAKQFKLMGIVDEIDYMEKQNKIDRELLNEILPKTKKKSKRVV